ncbi:MAG TPA: hypothetical protein VFU94_15315 [Conexibacter sp.]|nr:hypothetical protein [Conexibacter sp.]
MRAIACAALCAALLLLAVGSSAAATWDVITEGSVRLASLGKLTFTAGGLSLECNVTLTTTFTSRDVPVREGEALGSVTGASWSNCTGGELETVLALPWSITYRSFAGTLPEELTSLRTTINGFAWRLSTFGGFVGCLYRGDLGLSFPLSGRNPYRTGLLTTGLESVRLVSGFGCPAEGRVSSTLGIGTALWRIIFGEPVNLRAEPRNVRAAGGAQVVTFTNVSGVEQVVTRGAWDEVPVTWTTAVNPCRAGEMGIPITGIPPGGECRITLTPEAGARDNEFRLLEAGGAILGYVTTTP